MLPLTIVTHSNTNAITNLSSSTNKISLTHLLNYNFQYPIQRSFNRRTRFLSLLTNIFLWLTFSFAIGVLQIGKHKLSILIKIIYGIIMMFIIIICYLFVLLESNGCIEQILLSKRIQIDRIKQELASLQRAPKFNNYLSVTLTNYYNSLRRKYIDYQLYDKSICQRLQSSFYRHIRFIETSFNIRQCYIHIPDFSIDNNCLCQIFFEYHLSIVGRDVDILSDDIEYEFQRLENKLFEENKKDFHVINNLAHIKRNISFRFIDTKQQDLLLGQRRTCLVYESKMNINYRWLLNENMFWIMTLIGLSWVFRVIFACLIPKIIVPIYIELEGAMPLHSTARHNEKYDVKGKRFG